MLKQGFPYLKKHNLQDAFTKGWEDFREILKLIQI